jgi:hypothetical protein
VAGIAVKLWNEAKPVKEKPVPRRQARKIGQE